MQTWLSYCTGQKTWHKPHWFYTTWKHGNIQTNKQRPRTRTKPQIILPGVTRVVTHEVAPFICLYNTCQHEARFGASRKHFISFQNKHEIWRTLQSGNNFAWICPSLRCLFPKHLNMKTMKNQGILWENLFFSRTIAKSLQKDYHSDSHILREA